MQEWELTGRRNGIWYTADLCSLQESDDVHAAKKFGPVSAFGFEDLRDRTIE